MIIALISLFFTGIALVFIGFLFSLNLLELSFEIRVNLRIINGLTIIIIIIGLILILLAAIQSVSLLKKNKKVIEALLSGELILQTEEKISESGTKPSSGIGGGLTIIRPKMSESEEATTSKLIRAPAKVKSEAKEPSIPKPKEEITKEPTQVAPKSIIEKEEMAKEEGVDVSLEEALEKIVDRYNDPKVAKSFQKWNETLMMTFPDLNKSYLYKINRDEGIELMEGYDEEAAVQVKLNSNIFIKMMTKQINPIKAYSSGELEVAGKMRDLLKLRKLMF
jgi:putative sterol carrier protein